jgi:hypothetical protein
VRTRRARVRAVSAALATLVVVALGAAWAVPASASAYRYWSYWYSNGSGGWTFSQVGAQRQPAAGSVDGWRFAVSGTAGSVKPRAAASFASICGAHAPAPSGQKLVGLVVDYGTSSDAPPGQHPPRGVDTYCAQVGEHGTSAQVLTAYASVRSDSGLVCAIDGYPANECGVIVTPSPKPKPTATSTRTTAPTHGSTSPTNGSSSRTPTHSTSSTAAPAASGTADGTPSDGSGAAATASAADSSGSPTPVAVGSGGVAPPSTGGGPPVGALAGVGLVVVVGAAALLRTRRGRPGPAGVEQL